ncbi:hypothetical protein H6P81_013554 [Aristolochia fimbriata]|uniref:Fe2OG dioxygenase domain-containing protein n=1 Tax=Aristolochia fimbriata TaxID=158543 RepID=A0AAV7EG97_ARIFI|nr:hypothetical protein H6P81_013554 [Aristolochia fimbriata]
MFAPAPQERCHQKSNEHVRHHHRHEPSRRHDRVAGSRRTSPRTRRRRPQNPPPHLRPHQPPIPRRRRRSHPRHRHVRPHHDQYHPGQPPHTSPRHAGPPLRRVQPLGHLPHRQPRRPPEVLASAMSVSRHFFSLPASVKRRYANNPVMLEGYGSRMGLDPNATLDWNDYLFHRLRTRADHSKWPRQPEDYRDVVTRYGDEIVALCGRLLAVLSSGLGLPENTLVEAFGGEPELGATFRVNFYPKCPEPEAALGLSPHSDPGILAVVQQNGVSGLEVKRIGEDGAWFRVPPVEDALVVIVGDQMEIATNGAYKSAVHRTAVNWERERMSMVVFVTPEGEKVIGPLEEMVEMTGGERNFDEMSFNDHRKLIVRALGVQGKSILATRASKTQYPPTN